MSEKHPMRHRFGLFSACVLAGSAAALAGDSARAEPPERVLALVQQARGSACLIGPVRPMPGWPLPSAVAAAAANGDAAAMHRVAEAYLAEPATQSGARQALHWLERAALAGHPAASADAGSAHAAGRGTAADDGRAATWWMFGATRGDPRSMACLSVAYLLGRGVPADPVEAARWALLREAQTGGRTLLRPNAAEFERALPAAEFLEARRRAAMPPGPAPAPDAAAAVPSQAGTPRRAADSLLAAPSLMEPAAAWASLPVTMPQLPPAPRPDTALFSGTGVVVARPGVVLTNEHVVAGCTGIEVQAGLARLGGVEVRAVNGAVDLALLAVPGLDRRPLPAAPAIRLGSEVVVLGFPGRGVESDRATATFGNVSAIGARSHEPLIQFTAPVQAGNMGGPLLDRRGQIAGVAVLPHNMLREIQAGQNPSQNVNFAIAPGTVARFLEDHGIRQTGEPRPEADLADLVEEAERSVVRIFCHRPRPSRPATERGVIVQPIPTSR